MKNFITISLITLLLMSCGNSSKSENTAISETSITNEPVTTIATTTTEFTTINTTTIDTTSSEANEETFGSDLIDVLLGEWTYEMSNADKTIITLTFDKENFIVDFPGTQNSPAEKIKTSYDLGDYGKYSSFYDVIIDTKMQKEGSNKEKQFPIVIKRELDKKRYKITSPAFDYTGVFYKPIDDLNIEETQGTTSPISKENMDKMIKQITGMWEATDAKGGEVFQDNLFYTYVFYSDGTYEYNIQLRSQETKGIYPYSEKGTYEIDYNLSNHKSAFIMKFGNKTSKRPFALLDDPLRIRFTSLENEDLPDFFSVDHSYLDQ